MPTVHVEAARIPDRDRLMEELESHGLKPEAVGEVEIEVPCEDGDTEACDELYRYVEDVVMKVGSTFVPVKHEGVIYLRPPTD
jgi:hypothetical protein